MAGKVYACEVQIDTIKQDTLQQRFLRLKGYIVGGDEKELLPGAYIYMGDKKKAIMTTDQKGEFLIPKIPAGKIKLSVSYTGYQEFSKEYDLQNDLDVGEIHLAPVILDEVLVEAIPPLSVQHGDTTQFNAAAMKVMADADLEDLLKKLPGFEIVDGKIMAQGKEVTKLYIDGMEYSFNDPAAALKNLPAKLVAHIQMYDERSEEAKFSGYDDGQKFRSLNIVTHDPKQLKVFGRAQAGYGITTPLKNTFRENNYDGSFAANLFDAKRKFTVSGDLRHTGQDNDLPGSQYKGKGGDNQSRGIYANISKDFGKKVSFSGNYRYSDNHSYSASLSNQNYFPTDRYENRIYDSENHSWSDGRNQSINIHTDFKLNEKNKIVLMPTLTFGNTHSRSLSKGGNLENSDTVNMTNTDSRNKSDHLNVNGNVLWMHAFSKKGRTFTMQVNGGFNRNLSEQLQNNEERTWNTENISKDTLRNILTNSDRKGYRWNVSVAWAEPLTEHVRLGVNYSYRESVDYSENESLTYQDKEFKVIIGIDSAQTNQLENSYRVHNYGVSYNYFFEKIRLTGVMNISHTEMKNSYEYLGRADSLIRSVYTDLSPRMSLGIQTSENSNLDVMYNGSSSSPNASQLQDVLNVANPLQIYQGNPGLKKSFMHNLLLNYTHSWPEQSVFFYSTLNMSQVFNQIASNMKFIQQDTIIHDYTILRGARLITPVNLNGGWNVSTNFNCSLPLKRLKMRLNASLSYSFSHTPSVYDDLKNMTDSHNGSLSLGLNTNISENFDFSLSSSSTYSFSENTTTGGSHYFREGITSYVNWLFWKNIFIRGGYNGSFYVNKKGEKVNQAKHILNAGIGKKLGKNRQMEISLSANDLLNEQNTVNYSLNDLYAETSYRTMPSSYYMLSFTYRFNSMDKLKNKVQ